MNPVLNFLTENWTALALDRIGQPSGLSSLVSIPSSRGRLIFLVFSDRSPQPILAVKIPRLASDVAGLAREADVLMRVHRVLGDPCCSVPRVITYEDTGGVSLLVETAIPGHPLPRPKTSDALQDTVNRVLDWLINFHCATIQNSASSTGWHEKLVERPLAYIASLQGLTTEESELIARCRELIRPLHSAKLPLVFAHGDFSRPNLIVGDTGEVGVVDWELAEPVGLPATDLFLFLASYAFLAYRARKPQQIVTAFQRAFFGADAWARPHVERYAASIGLPLSLVPALLLLCWCRYLGNFHSLLSAEDVGAAGPPPSERLQWFRDNRFMQLSRYTVEHFAELERSYH